MLMNWTEVIDSFSDCKDSVLCMPSVYNLNTIWITVVFHADKRNCEVDRLVTASWLTLKQEWNYYRQAEPNTYSEEKKYLTSCWFCTFAHWQRNDESIILIVGLF